MIHMPTSFLLIGLTVSVLFLSNIFIWRFSGRQPYFITWTIALGMWGLGFITVLTSGLIDLWIPSTFFHIIWLVLIRIITDQYFEKSTSLRFYFFATTSFVIFIILELFTFEYYIRGSLLSGFSAYLLAYSGLKFLRKSTKIVWQQQICGTLLLVYSFMWIVRIGFLLTDSSISNIIGQNTANSLHIIVLATTTVILNIGFILLALQKNLSIESQLETRGTLALFESLGVGLIHQTNDTIKHLINQAFTQYSSDIQGDAINKIEQATILIEYRNALLNPGFLEYQSVYVKQFLTQMGTILSTPERRVYLTVPKTTKNLDQSIPVKFLLTILAFLVKLMDEAGLIQNKVLQIEIDWETNGNNKVQISILVNQDIRKLTKPFLTLTQNLQPNSNTPDSEWLKVDFQKTGAHLLLTLVIPTTT